jgi:hypothetical protein
VHEVKACLPANRFSFRSSPAGPSGARTRRRKTLDQDMVVMRRIPQSFLRAGRSPGLLLASDHGTLKMFSEG